MLKVPFEGISFYMRQPDIKTQQGHAAWLTSTLKNPKGVVRFFIMHYREISCVFNSWVSGKGTLSVLLPGLKYRLSGLNRN